ncbi:MAG: hypothetical protein QOH76_3946 [Thermoleophilaceae bacterium]|jgi:hypothetical protein|nr:hypothetical protein [Thermoleophilaceae bacterium]
MARRCVFCGGDPVNQEHALPRWASRLFTDEVVDFARTIQYRDSEAEVRPWRGRPFSATVGGPCIACNGGWMSDLEQQVAPILTPLIRGGAGTLDPVAQHLVATWAVKTMLMLRLVVSDRDDAELDPGMYRWLRDHRAPPPAEQVWVSTYAGEGQWPISFHYYAITIARPDEPFPEQPTGHGAALSVGHLAFGLAGHRLADGPAATPSLPAQTLRPLWPAYGAAVELPTAETLAGDSEMRSLATPAEWR